MPKGYISRTYFKSVPLQLFNNAVDEYKRVLEQEQIKITDKTNELRTSVNGYDKEIFLSGNEKAISAFKKMIVCYQTLLDIKALSNDALNNLYYKSKVQFEKEVNNGTKKLTNDEKEMIDNILVGEYFDKKYDNYISEVKQKMKELNVPDNILEYCKNPSKKLDLFIDNIYSEELESYKNHLNNLDIKEKEKIKLEQTKINEEKERIIKEQKAKDSKKETIIKFFEKHDNFLTDRDKSTLNNYKYSLKAIPTDLIVKFQKQIYNCLQLEFPDDNVLKTTLINDEAEPLMKEYDKMNPDNYVKAIKNEFNRFLIDENGNESEMYFDDKVNALKLYSDIKRRHESRVQPKWWHFFYKKKYKRETEYIESLEKTLKEKGITEKELKDSLTTNANFIVASTEIEKAKTPFYYNLNNLANDRIMIKDEDALSRNINEFEIKRDKEIEKDDYADEIKKHLYQLIKEHQGVNLYDFKTEEDMRVYSSNDKFKDVPELKNEEAKPDKKDNNEIEIEMAIIPEEDLLDDNSNPNNTSFIEAENGQLQNLEKDDVNYVHDSTPFKIWEFGTHNAVDEKKIPIDDINMPDALIDAIKIYNNIDFKYKNIIQIKSIIEKESFNKSRSFEEDTVVEDWDVLFPEKLEDQEELADIKKLVHKQIQGKNKINELKFESEFDFEEEHNQESIKNIFDKFEKDSEEYQKNNPVEETNINK